MSRPELVHRCAKRCITELRFPEPAFGAIRTGVQPEIVVNLQRDKVSLWAEGTILNWRFTRRAISRHDDPQAMKHRVRKLFRAAVGAWGETPVAFRESDKEWDFEIAVLNRKDCDDEGCTLASAFFPESERQRLLVYPSMFDYDHAEQVSTLVHELGHIFGLRHYFADADKEEKTFPSLVFGKHSSFTVMNYGPKSRLTMADRRDLKRLYEAAWSADAQAEIGKQVRLVQAPHSARQ